MTKWEVNTEDDSTEKKKKRQIKKRDNCQISTQKDMVEEIRTKIKLKRPVCDSKWGKPKSFPLSLLSYTFSPNPK